MIYGPQDHDPFFKDGEDYYWLTVGKDVVLDPRIERWRFELGDKLCVKRTRVNERDYEMDRPLLVTVRGEGQTLLKLVFKHDGPLDPNYDGVFAGVWRQVGL